MTTTDYNPWLHRFGVFVAAMVLFMIVAGGMVTSMEAGDSVPDWPLAYGQVFPPMPGNVFYEVGHRMIGWTLGILVIALTVWVLRHDRRRYVRNMAILGLVGVCFQGALGGLRVTFVSNPTVQDAMMSFLGIFGVKTVATALVCIATFHTAVAQSYFCLMASLALVLSRSWTQPDGPIESPIAGKLQKLCTITIIMILVQLVLGAVRRHTDSSLALMLHLGGAGLVALHIALIAKRVFLQLSGQRMFVRMATVLMAMLGVQVGLGVGAWILVERKIAEFTPTTELFGSAPLGAAVQSSHVGLGALILATCVLLKLRAHRHMATPADATSSSSGQAAKVATA